MKQFKIGCRTMRDGIIVSSVFMATGIAMLLVGRYLVPPLLGADALVQGFGVVLLLFVPFILITTYLRTAHTRADAEPRPEAG